MGDYVTAYVHATMSNAKGNDAYVQYTGDFGGTTVTSTADCVTTDDWRSGCDWTRIESGQDGQVLFSSGCVPEWQPWPAPIPAKLECKWCGQANKGEREQCRGCGAPLLEG